MFLLNLNKHGTCAVLINRELNELLIDYILTS